MQSNPAGFLSSHQLLLEFPSQSPWYLLLISHTKYLVLLPVQPVWLHQSWSACLSDIHNSTASSQTLASPTGSVYVCSITLYSLWPNTSTTGSVHVCSITLYSLWPNTSPTGSVHVCSITLYSLLPNTSPTGSVHVCSITLPLAKQLYHRFSICLFYNTLQPFANHLSHWFNVLQHCSLWPNTSTTGSVYYNTAASGQTPLPLVQCTTTLQPLAKHLYHWFSVLQHCSLWPNTSTTGSMYVCSTRKS